MQDPELFLEELVRESAPALLKDLALLKLKTFLTATLQPVATQKGLKWEPVEASLEKVLAMLESSTLEQVQSIVQEPTEFMNDFVKKHAPDLIDAIHGKMSEYI